MHTVMVLFIKLIFLVNNLKTFHVSIKYDLDAIRFCLLRILFSWDNPFNNLNFNFIKTTTYFYPGRTILVFINTINVPWVHEGYTYLYSYFTCETVDTGVQHLYYILSVKFLVFYVINLKQQSLTSSLLYKSWVLCIIYFIQMTRRRCIILHNNSICSGNKIFLRVF